MGQSCSTPPRMKPFRVSSKTSENQSTIRSSSHQTVSQQTTQLCNHNVCSILRKKDWEATEKMVRTGQGIDISLTKFLERALYEGCPTEIAEMLIESGANPLESTRVLSDAILGKVEYKVVKRLLDMGCSPNQESEQDKLRRTPIHFACQAPTTPQIVDLLLDRGGDLNMAVGERQWTPVHYLACANHDPAMLRKVILRGGDVNAQASDGTTPMAVAAFKRAPVDFFRAMLEVGADPAIETRMRRTPLYYIKHNDENSAVAGDLRLILLDPQIHRKQLFALACALHKRLGKASQASRLSPDLIVLIGQFVGVKRFQCEDEDSSALDYE